MRRFLLLLAFMMLCASPAAADDVATAQSVIRSQAEAFARDDAAAAYSYAAPEIRRRFSQADIFLRMVRNNYAPVYRHKSFEFAEAGAIDGKITQHVRIVDADGVAWRGMRSIRSNRKLMAA